MQYHHLDESGNLGFGEGEGITRYLVLAMLQLPDNSPLPELAALRREFHLLAEFEFKYYRAKPKQKESFFKSIQELNFRVRGAIIDKQNLDETLARVSPLVFEAEFIARLTMRASEAEIGNDVLVIDAGSDALCRAVRVRLSEKCRKSKRARPFSKIVGARSERYDGLQMADMLAGAIMHYVMRTEEEYYLSFRDKVADLWWVKRDGT